MDTRLRKLKQEQDKKSKQWAVYEQQMKQKFAKQRKLFEADLQRIAKEANEAAEQGQLAAQRVKEVVNHGYVEPAEAMEDDDEAWDALMKGDKDEQLQESFLKIALQATTRTEEPRASSGVRSVAACTATTALGAVPWPRVEERCRAWLLQLDMGRLRGCRHSSRTWTLCQRIRTLHRLVGRTRSTGTPNLRG